MPEVKPQEFERSLRSSASLARIMLFFGPDRGLVSERAQRAAEKTGISLDDPFSITQLDVSDLQKDHGRLADEINSVGLFGGEKLVWLKNAGNEKYLVDSLSAICENPPTSAWLIIEAGDLKKTSALRKLGTGKSICAVACYADDARSLGELVDEELNLHGKKISSAARSRLLESLGGDRIASRGEIRKLVLYCLKDQVIEEHHVLEIIGDASATSIDDVIDALLNGDRIALVASLSKVMSSKTPVYQLLNAVLRQFHQLAGLRGEMDNAGIGAAQAVERFGRAIFFKRKPFVTKALNVWTSERLSRESARLQSTILQAQRNPLIGDSIATQLLLSLTLQSAARSR